MLSELKKIFLILLGVQFSPFISHAQGVWTQRTSLPDTARGYGIGFSIGNYGYAGLGYNINISKGFHDFWQFNPVTNSWIQKANFPGKGVTCPVTFVIGHKAFIVTGSTTPDASPTCSKECWEYDANSNTWTRKADFPGIPRTCAIGFAIGGKGYFGTGYDSNNLYHNDFWQYDTSTNSWTQKNNFSGSKRYGGIGFAVGAKGYLCFGADTIVGTNVDIWQYDTGTDSWTKKSNCPGDSVYLTDGFVIDTNIYVGTGQDGLGNYYRTFWKYSTTLDGWTQEVNFIATARGVSSAFAIGDTGYMGLGANTDIFNTYNDWFKFYPGSLAGFSASNNENMLNVYPNPFSRSCMIRLPNSLSELKPNIELRDVLGRTIDLKIAGNNGNYIINRGNLIEGVYFLSVRIQNQFYYKKLIINN